MKNRIKILKLITLLLISCFGQILPGKLLPGPIFPLQQTAIGLNTNLAVNFTAIGSNPTISTTIEGTYLPSPQYVQFSGSSGLKLQISMPSTSNFSYTIQFQFKLNNTINDLVANVTGTQYLFYFVNGPYCLINGPYLICNFLNIINLSQVTDVNSWNSFTMIAN